MTVALRNLKKNKWYSLITLSGLIVGFTLFFLIYIWILNELSYDRYHQNADFIYRVGERKHFSGHTNVGYNTPGLLADSLRENFSEVEYAVRTAWTGERVIRRGERQYFENDIICADKDFFSMFTFHFIKGNAQTSLNEPYGAIITESFSQKYFGDEDPIGKQLEMENKYTFTVTGLIKDVPANSHFWFGMVVPFEIVEKLGWRMKTWEFSLATTFVHLKPGIDVKGFEKKIASQVKKHHKGSRTELFLQPLTEMHLYSTSGNTGGLRRIQYIYVFSVVGFLILCMAGINYMNMATARSEMRSLEIGIRKVVGAGKMSLVRQFLLEAVLLSMLALVLVPVLLYLLLPEFNAITGEQFTFSIFLKPGMILAMLLIALITGILSGSYPALVLSSLKPKTIFQYGAVGKLRGIKIRTILVSVQIISFLLLISGASIIGRQLSYLKNLELGIDKNNVMIIPLGISNQDNVSVYRSLKNELSSYPAVQNISGSFTHPFRFGTPGLRVTHQGKRLDKDVAIKLTSVDYDYLETLKINILEGRGFSRQYGDEKRNVLVNETFAHLLGTGSVVNQLIKLNGTPCKIIGVTKDFHISRVTESAIQPLVFFLSETGINHIIIRLKPANIAESLKFIGNVWKRINPAFPFQYHFLDANYNVQFKGIENLGKTIRYFSIVGVFIACLGLLGMAAFSAQKRYKEIGIRKVLGSSTINLVYLLCKDYIRIVLIAILSAWPIGWLVMTNWLANYPNRITLNHEAFILAGLISVAITIGAVIFQAIKAANSNPVDSLRME